MVNIPESRCWQLFYIPELWSTYQKYGQQTIDMVKIPKIWSKYQTHGQNTRKMVNIPEIQLVYQKYGQNTRNMVNIQLSKSSRALNGGAYFSDVSGWKSILTSATEAYDHTESYRLLGFYLTITFCLKPTQQAVSLWNCRVCWRICLFYLYGFVTAGKYLWSPRWEILQFQWQFQ